MTYRLHALTVLSSLALAGLAGCGLISSDVTDFDISLPDKKFSIDTDAYQINKTEAQMAFAQSCAAQPTVCGEIAQQACSMGCTGTCSTTTQTCDLVLDVSVVQPVDLLMEAPDLKTVSDQSVVKVSIASVTYEITDNTLNVATPEITLYVAPMAVVKTDPTNAQIKAIATIAPVPAGMVTSGPQPVKFTATGQADLQNIMASFKTPFNILVGSQIEVDSASQVPTGRLDAVVHVTGKAGL